MSNHSLAVIEDSIPQLVESAPEQTSLLITYLTPANIFYTALTIFVCFFLFYLYINRKVPFTQWKKHIAILLDKNGFEIGRKKLKFNEPTFEFKKGTYNFKPQNSTFFTHSTMFTSLRFYLYHFENPDPIKIPYQDDRILRAQDLKTLLDSDALVKLNAFANRTDWSALFTPRNITIAIIAIVAIFYFANGGSIT